MGQNGRDYLERVHSIDVLSARLERTFLGSEQDGTTSEKSHR